MNFGPPFNRASWPHRVKQEDLQPPTQAEGFYDTHEQVKETPVSPESESPSLSGLINNIFTINPRFAENGRTPEMYQKYFLEGGLKHGQVSDPDDEKLIFEQDLQDFIEWLRRYVRDNP